jgi:hypothetical protein
MVDQAAIQKAEQYLCRHMVGLCWYEGDSVNLRGQFTRQPDYRCASAFLLQICNSFSLVTAGHVLTEYKKAVAAGRIGQRFSMVDVWQQSATFLERIPFDFMDSPALVHDDVSQGLDVAFISLPDIFLTMLLQTTAPFIRKQWIAQQGLEFDFYVMAGIPAVEAVKEFGESGSERWVATFPTPRAIFVENCDNRPPSWTGTQFPQFIGRIKNTEDIAHIGGMSGGPILGFRTIEGRLAYWPVAIQSRWDADSRRVVGTTIPAAAQLAHDVIDDFLADNPHLEPPC